MEQIGEIVSLEGDMAVIKIRRNTSCGENCAMCGGCGGKKAEIRILNTLSAKVGQRVRLKNNSSSVLCLALITYALPLVGMMLCYAAFKSSALAIGALFLLFFLCAMAANALAKKETFKTKMTDIL